MHAGTSLWIEYQNRESSHFAQFGGTETGVIETSSQIGVPILVEFNLAIGHSSIDLHVGRSDRLTVREMITGDPLRGTKTVWKVKYPMV